MNPSGSASTEALSALSLSSSTGERLASELLGAEGVDPGAAGFETSAAQDAAPNPAPATC